MNAEAERFLCDCWPGRLVIGAAVLILLLSGCHRAHYRRQADRDAYTLIERGSCDPRWSLNDYRIDPDPRSRFYDPCDPDHPPMPPDDPTAHQLMHFVDGKKGWKHWHRNGETSSVENPHWMAYLPTNEAGQVVLNRETVVQLAALHSREYQRQMEELYLSALDVSYERFLFDTHFFGGHSTFFTADGRLRGRTGAGYQVPGNSRSTLGIDNDLSFSRTLATGGELLAGAANSIVWQFSGAGTYSTFTLLDFSLVQPLLRGAGRAVALENLTEVERALLANIRQMERFRRGFYGQIIAGLNPGSGPSRSGGSLAAPAASGASGGFFGLLEEEVRIRNQRANVDSLKDSLEQLQALYDAGRIDSRYQVDHARQAMLNAQSQLLTLRTNYNNRLDAYKVTLGLPPDLPVVVDDDLLKRFDLMDPALMELREHVATLQRQLRDPNVPLPADFPQQLAAICQESSAQLEVVRDDIQELLEALPTRQTNLRLLASREELQSGEVDPMVADVDALNRRVDILRQEYEALIGPLTATLSALENQEPPPPAPLPNGEDDETQMQHKALQELVDTLSDQLLQLSVVQAMARLDTVTILPVDLEPEQALAIARENRLDWMNARAELVDRWRRIEIIADRLRAGLDVTVSGDLSTTDNNPLRFRSPTGQMRMGLAFDAPLTRLQERNLYRETLIRYQQARRDYISFVDRINQNLRDTLRTMRVTQLGFEVRRAAVLVSITQVDIARMKLQQPPQAGETSRMGATVSRDLVSAITSLLQAQNSFLSVWVDYEVQRMNLDFQLGTMRLDERGIWIDPGEITPEKFAPSGESEEIPPGLEETPEALGPEAALFPPPPIAAGPPSFTAPTAPPPPPPAPPPPAPPPPAPLPENLMPEPAPLPAPLPAPDKPAI